MTVSPSSSNPTVDIYSLIAAWLFVAVIVLVIVAIAVPEYPKWVTGVVAWVACILLSPRLTPRQFYTVMGLIVVGGLGIAWGIAHGQNQLLLMALTQNVPLTGMLIAVSFLQLIAVKPQLQYDEPLAKGRGALMQTMLGVHLFGAVINFSAVAIFADRLSARVPLNMSQGMALSQAFIVGAVWSPFYGAMAAALTAAPGASLAQLMLWGLPIAVIGMAVTYSILSTKEYDSAREFVGYPLHVETLWVPAMLAAIVLLVHEWHSDWSVLAIIAAVAPLVTMLTLLFTRPQETAALCQRLITNRLPSMNAELTLFMAAAMLSAGMSGAIVVLNLGVPFDHFGPLAASIILVVMNICAWFGMHPIILVSVLGPWLSPLQPDQNLMAMTFLMSWGVGLTACPMSNTMLAMAGRYRLPFGQLLALNRIYSLKMTIICISIIYTYCAMNGIA